MQLYEAAGCRTASSTSCLARAPRSATSRLAHPDFAGIHFTGSTSVFQGMWKTVGENIEHYRSYPRLVGETGGKNFVFAHPSADPGCARDGHRARRLRVPGAEVLGGLARLRARVVWAGAQPRWPTFDRAPDGRRGATSATSWARSSTRTSFNQASGGRAGEAGAADARDPRRRRGGRARGLLREPTLVADRPIPAYNLMREEIFGPVVMAFVYDDARVPGDAARVDSTSPYALTGAVVRARPRAIVARDAALRTRPATSTSTTSPPAPWSASSPSAAPAPRARTTRPAH